VSCLSRNDAVQTAKHAKYAKEEQGESVIKRAELRSPKREQQRKRKNGAFLEVFSRGLRISRFLQQANEQVYRFFEWCLSGPK